MPLAARIQMALLVAAAAIVVRSAVADESIPTKSECIASSESGQDLRHGGKLIDARLQFAACAAAGCPGPVRDDCAQHLDEIASAMPSVIFDVKDAAGRAVVGVTITMEGKRVVAGGGAAIYVDPGEHTFGFEAVGLNRLEKRLILAEGVKERREVVVMERADAAPIAITTPAPTSVASRRFVPPPALSWVAFGVGGAGLLLGVTAGLVAGGKHSTLAGECDNNADTCAPQHAGDLDSFHTWRTVSTVAYVVSVLGVAGGGVLWLTTPTARNATTTGVWLGPASAGVAGRF